jgi:serine/threonine protein kinase
MKPLGPDDPKKIGQYELFCLLGEGGMGRVYLGNSPGGRPVAVKVIQPEHALDPDFLARFRSEVAAAKKVSGAYTASVVKAEPDDNPPWLATEFVAGPSLADAVATIGRLPVDAVWRLAAGLVEALQEVHGCNLIHRDLKPGNVLLAANGPKVIDFGISRAVAGPGQTRTGQHTATGTGGGYGTPGFMSPEQFYGYRVGPRQRHLRARPRGRVRRDRLRGGGEQPRTGRAGRPGRDPGGTARPGGKVHGAPPGGPAVARAAARRGGGRAGPLPAGVAA